MSLHPDPVEIHKPCAGHLPTLSLKHLCQQNIRDKFQRARGIEVLTILLIILLDQRFKARFNIRVLNIMLGQDLPYQFERIGA